MAFYGRRRRRFRGSFGGAGRAINKAKIRARSLGRRLAQQKRTNKMLTVGALAVGAFLLFKKK